MPSNYRPYYPRVYNRGVNQNVDYSSAFSGGESFGKQLGGGIAEAIQQAKQDKVANQLLAQNYPDQPGGTDPDPDPFSASGAPITDPNTPIPDVQLPAIQGNFQGGVEELKARQQFQQQNLEQQIKQAQLANFQAEAAGTGRYAARAKGVTPGVTATGGGSSSRWFSGDGGAGGGGGGGAGGGAATTKSGKPVVYQSGSGDVQNDESTDNSSQIASDFDAAYGQKGLYGKYMANLPNLKPDANGNYPLTDSKGNVVASVPGSDATLWQQRTNAARLKSGLQPIGPLGTGQNPTSNAVPGTQTNPVVAQSKLHVRSLPFGTYVFDPNTGQTYQKQQPPSQ